MNLWLDALDLGNLLDILDLDDLLDSLDLLDPLDWLGLFDPMDLDDLTLLLDFTVQVEQELKTNLNSTCHVNHHSSHMGFMVPPFVFVQICLWLMNLVMVLVASQVVSGPN